MSKARVLADLVAAGGELADGTISVAEVTGAAPTADPTFTGTVGAAAITATGTIAAATINASTSLQIGGVAVTASAADLNGVAGINTNVQSQLDAKSPLASPTFTGTATIPTAAIAVLELAGTSVSGIGTGANNLVQLNGSAQLPAVDGSQLTNIAGYSVATAMAYGNALS